MFRQIVVDKAEVYLRLCCVVSLTELLVGVFGLDSWSKDYTRIGLLWPVMPGFDFHGNLVESSGLPLRS